jgi:hypothetical protein
MILLPKEQAATSRQQQNIDTYSQRQAGIAFELVSLEI